MTTHLEQMDHDQAERATELLENAMRSKGFTRDALRNALEQGFMLAAYYGPPETWPDAGSAASAAGRLLLRLSRELFLPLESLGGASAIAVAREILEDRQEQIEPGRNPAARA